MDALCLISVLCFVADAQELDTRYPPFEVCERNRAIADKFVEQIIKDLEKYGLQSGWDMQLSVMGGGMRGQYLLGLHRRAIQRRAVWYELTWVTSPQYGLEVRKHRRAVLRKLVGDRAFVTGDWPNPIPVEFLPRE